MSLSKSIPGSRFAGKLLPFLILFIPLLIVVPGWDGFVYSPRAAFSDISISHYPNALFLVDSLRQGQFPLWSPTILGGYPFAADPLSGLWYLPGWPAYLFALPFGFNLNILLHLMWSGLGMWFFLKALDLQPLPVLAGALAWELLPKTFAHFGAGHLTLIYALSWTPWLILAERKFRFGRFSFLSGIILGLIGLADIRWAAYAGAAWLVCSAWWGLSEASVEVFTARVWRYGGHLMETILLAGLIAGPQLLPLLEYIQNSTRSGLTLEDNLTLSLSPLYLFGFLAPAFQGYAEWVVYPGAIAVIAFLWCLAQPALRRKVGFWLVVMAGALLLSMGAYFPLNQWISRLPGMDLLRVPSRFMLIFGFAAAVMLACFLNRDGRSDPARSHFWGNLLSFGMAVFAWIIVAGLWIINASMPFTYLWGAVFLTVAVSLTAMRNGGWIPQPIFQSAAIVLVVLDLGAVSQSNFVYREPGAVLGERDEVAAAISAMPGDFRIYSPSYSIPQQTAAFFRLEMVNGVDPLQIKDFVRFMAIATQIPSQTYSVTMPPFANGDPAHDNQQYVPDPISLGFLNVAYVVSDFPLQAAQLDLINQIQDTFIYNNTAVFPRAWVQNTDLIDRNAIWGVLNYVRTPNQLSMTATGPGVLVLSEIIYPGWIVTVDGVSQEIEPVGGLFRGVRLASGSHQIVFSFQPLSITLGLICALLGWLWCGYRWRFSRR